MISVFQVFRRISIETRSNKVGKTKSENPSMDLELNIHCKLKDGILYLKPELIEQVSATKNATLVVFTNDKNSKRTFYHQNAPFILLSNKKKCSLDIFDLHIDETHQLHLKYNRYAVGLPERADFKLCDLHVGKTVEILINGKYDSAGASRRERTYIEQQYIWSYLGDFCNDEIKVLKNGHTDQLPRIDKKINLRKLMW